jgi:hypothetical protein
MVSPKDSSNQVTQVAGAGHGVKNASMPTRYMIDVHAHVGLPKAAFPVAEELHSALDWGGYRSKDPVGFAAIVSEPQADNTDLMISKMDQNGVTHAIIQPTPGNGSSNEFLASMVKRWPDRFFGIYRPEFLMSAAGSGDVSQAKERR